ncbi:hypothetical protein CYMTET_48695 [Cymbomonas tetramitiformis]|uniref:DUF7802 domain-containing protein n=1 Tax=Cymbomonas tetramitiformis TaxID=36881 RepID=A0AAE0EVH2_9CHLO|nr:hypothetical protein CYMTET_48695 [Cymbomonas tetramitiformis]
MYYPQTAAIRLRLDPVAEAMATGLLGALFYGVYDINGPRFLWWTWHDTDAAISERFLNAPFGSTMWILTYTAIHCLLHRWITRPMPQLSAVLPKVGGDILTKMHGFLYSAPGVVKVFFCGASVTPLFMIAMGIFSVFSLDIPGKPAERTIGLCLLTYFIVILWNVRNRQLVVKDKFFPEYDKVLFFFVTLDFCTHTCINALGNPENHVSHGVHQTAGSCEVKNYDIMGFERNEYLCVESDPSQASVTDYQTSCAVPGGIAPSPTGMAAEWYSVCGLAHNDRVAEFVGLATIAVIGIASYAFCLINSKEALSKRKSK